MDFKLYSLSNIFISALITLFVIPGVASGHEEPASGAGFIEEPAKQEWVRNNCQKTNRTKEIRYPRPTTYYDQYECDNPQIEANLVNRDRSRQGIEFTEQEKTIKYQVKLSLRNSEDDYFYNRVGDGSLPVSVTHFGPKKNFITTFGSENFTEIQVQNKNNEWISAQSYTGYGLDTPVSVSLNPERNSKETLNARVSVERPIGFPKKVDKLNIFSSFVQTAYNKKKRVWLKRPQKNEDLQLSETAVKENITTSEGVTVRASEPMEAEHVAGELESILSVSPERNQATLILTQTRTNPGKDTSAAVYLRSWENLAENATDSVEWLSPSGSILVGEGTVLSGEGSIYRSQVPGIPVNCYDKKLGQYNVQINYQLLEGTVGKKAENKSPIQGVSLQNPASSNNGACGE